MLARYYLPVNHRPTSVYSSHHVEGLEGKHTRMLHQFGYPCLVSKDLTTCSHVDLRIDRFGDAPTQQEEQVLAMSSAIGEGGGNGHGRVWKKVVCGMKTYDFTHFDLGVRLRS